MLGCGVQGARVPALHTSLWHARNTGSMATGFESFVLQCPLLSSDLASCRSNAIIKNSKDSSCFAVMEILIIHCRKFYSQLAKEEIQLILNVFKVN